MNGKVILSNSIIDIIDDIHDMSTGYDYLYYIYGKDDVDQDLARMLLPEFIFISYNDILTRNNEIVDGKFTFYIIKNMRITKIPDRRLGFLQRATGYKLVIDNHPFSENGKTYHVYYNYSLIKKSILGYPHSYAFRDAQETDTHKPFDPVLLAEKVKPYTICYIDEIYKGISYNAVMLTKQQMREYEMLKAYLFDETLDSPLTIVRKLRKYTRSFLPQRGLNLLNLSKIYKQYIKGIKNVWITDAKVDIFLKQEFDRHIGDVNTFIEVLNG